eukprot:904831-Amphidinium_carterae.2
MQHRGTGVIKTTRAQINNVVHTHTHKSRGIVGVWQSIQGTLHLEHALTRTTQRWTPSQSNERPNSCNTSAIHKFYADAGDGFWAMGLSH